MPQVLLLYKGGKLLYYGYIFFITVLQDNRIWRQEGALRHQQFPKGKITCEVSGNGE